jgi:DNA repair exonuclease SbcCD nuclease subunit
MKPFRFVHASDAHLGYRQYHLPERQQDYMNAFREFVEKTRELSPDFVIFAGDLFNDPHPSNVVLSSAIELIDSLKLPFLVVPGSHDAVYSSSVGTVLDPLHKGGHIHYLPLKPFELSDVYVYGMKNFRTRAEFEKGKKEFFEKHPPTPKGKYNIFVLHQGVDFPKLGLHQAEVELYPSELPGGFQYYASGHLHAPAYFRFKKGLFAYSGSLETTDYTQYKYEKGFYLVEVEGDGETNITRVPITCYRKFNIIEEDFSGLDARGIEEKARRLISEADEQECILVLVLEGILPRGVSRVDVDYESIRKTAGKALYLRLINNLKTPEEAEVPIKLAEAETIFAKARKILAEYYAEAFRERAEEYASFTVELVKILSDKSMKTRERTSKAEKKIDMFYQTRKEGESGL